jgi:hypothetical protein
MCLKYMGAVATDIWSVNFYKQIFSFEKNIIY